MRIRSGYSFKAAYGKLPDVLSRLKELGWTAAPISDRLSTFAFRRWSEKAQAEGLRPIYGVELPCTPSLSVKKPPVDFWACFAKKDIKDLHEVISICTEFNGKEPVMSYRAAFSSSDLIKIAGERVLLGDLPPEALTDDDFYIALSPSTPVGLYKRAKDTGYKFCASSDNYYPRAEDLELYRIASGFRGGTQTYPRHILSDDELREWFAYMGYSDDDVQSAFANRQKIMDECHAGLRKAKLLVPKKPKPLKELCADGAKRNGIDLSDPVYSTRLERELAIIAEKDFEDYFYILADLISYAKQHMVVGPARGSSCGSLVCYLLHITEIDPIPYGLIFERFIDVNRKDLPDIDVDFSDSKRHLVFEYAEKTYGRAHVARLGTVGLFRYRSALKQVGQALALPSWEYEKVADGIIERPGDTDLVERAFETDLGQKLLKDHPNMRIAATLEGHPTNGSQHAAGVVITDTPVTDYVAVNAKTRGTFCDKEDAEVLNLLKLDALGLTQLSIFERTLELIGKKPISGHGFLESLPLDDSKVFEVLNSARFCGIFQFTGKALQGLTTQVKVDKLEDLVALTALARPGPLAFADTWIRRRNKKEEVTTLHPLLTELLKDTYGVLLYQEQVMRLCREIGDMSWEDTSAVRKGIGKKLGPQFLEKYYPKWLAGSSKKGISETTARQIWDQIPAFGVYAFNKSHSVAYAVMSYWSCWFKAYHPVEFAAATLDGEKDIQKQIEILRELSEEGVDYIPVDSDYSSDRWTKIEKEGKTTLVGPLTSIKGIGAKTVRDILDSRAKGIDLRQSTKELLAKAKTSLDSLFPVRDRVRELYPDLSTINIISEPLEIRKAQIGVRGDVVIIGVIKRANVKDENTGDALARRGGKQLSGPSKSLNLFVADDSDEIFCKIDRYKFDNLGMKILNTVKVGKSIFAIKGRIPPGFRMISIDNIRYIGEIE
jgi:DNA-directed DNA polymerase III PolC